MGMDKEKYGISQAELKNAALGDFDDYVPEQTKPALKVAQPIAAAQATKSGASAMQTSQKSNPKKEKKEKKNIQIPENVSSFVSNLYIVNFVKSLFCKERIGVCIWLVLNMLILIAPFIFVAVDTGDASVLLPGITFGIVGYSISLVIALSPVGEWILRFQTKCKKIKNQQILERLQPLFDEVYARAKEKDPTISDKVKLFISTEDCPNAFATGRRTICVTEGLLALSDEDIKAVLAHEFGHLSHKDTDIILAVSVGNMIVTAIVSVINFFTLFFVLVVGGMCSKNKNVYNALYKIVNFLFYIIMYLWTKLGFLLCLYSNRKGEYKADAFAVDLGYGEELSHALVTIDNGDFPKSLGLWASLSSTHPQTADRINEMKIYGAQKTVN